MPPIFKALASISAWILFVAGCSHFLSTFVLFVAGGFGGEDWQRRAAFVAIGTASIILSVVAMKLRQMLE